MPQRISPGVLVVPQNEVEGRWLCEQLAGGGYQGECVVGVPEALSRLSRRDLGLCLSHARHAGALLPDVKMSAPGFPVVVLDDQDSVETAVDMMRRGAADYLNPRSDAGRLLDKVRQHCRGVEDAAVIRTSPQSDRLFDLAARVANTDVSVLIMGESGTGKEVVARYIHRASRRSRAPFVAINCAAIPDNMLEAILFGHMKGAFTGAVQNQPGKFELAHGGTLLLDEISEMPLALQAKLLRVLQEREVERVGAHAPVPVDVRVLATTNLDIKMAISDGRFREDLYYRLSVFPLQLAPLRERPADVEALARHFLDKYLDVAGEAVSFTPQALTALRSHNWPGNVRELENTVQRALVLRRSGEIAAAELGLPSDMLARCEAGGSALAARVQGTEGDVIREALAAHGGQRRRTAESLGISERTLRYKLARLRAQGTEV
jgi:two-component system response regulator FlrC